jgi:hypothetical protein
MFACIATVKKHTGVLLLDAHGDECGVLLRNKRVQKSELAVKEVLRDHLKHPINNHLFEMIAVALA